MFGAMFGGGSGGGGPRRGLDTVLPIAIDLETLYAGDTKKLKLTRQVLCKACGGYVERFYHYRLRSQKSGCFFQERRQDRVDSTM